MAGSGHKRHDPIVPLPPKRQRAASAQARDSEPVMAPRAATEASQHAADAALATSEAAKNALAAAVHAETLAAETARAAKFAPLAAQADAADSESEVALAEVEETAARGRYRDAYDRAAQESPVG